MKHGKKPTKNQKIFIKSWGLIPENWLVVKDTPAQMLLVHRHNDQTTRTIRKDVKE